MAIEALFIFRPARLALSRTLAGLKKNQEELSRLAAVDGMTGLLNHRTGLEILNKEVERAKRSGVTLALAFIDLDDLKVVNDTVGHDEGDWVIGAFARVITRSIRVSDSAIRYGGDEFMIIFPECDLETAASIMSRIMALTDELTVIEEKT